MKKDYDYRALKFSKEATKRMVEGRAKDIAKIQKNIQLAKRINREIAGIVSLLMFPAICWLFIDKKVAPDFSHFILKISMEFLLFSGVIMVICNMILRKSPGNGFLRTLQKNQRADRKYLRRINRTLLNPQYLS